MSRSIVGGEPELASDTSIVGGEPELASEQEHCWG